MTRSLLHAFAALCCAALLFACEPAGTPEPVFTPDGAIAGGLFSVSDARHVQFSRGNLRYQPSTGIWSFAYEQFESVGAANSSIGPAYDGCIDLFGYGTGNNPTLVSTDPDDYPVYPFSDWGANSIANGGNRPGLWRTLSAGEWNYLLDFRPDARNLRANAIIRSGNDSISGLILLPDEWVTPKKLDFFTTDLNQINVFTLKGWSIMQAAGAVFLPATGLRDTDDGNAVNYPKSGCYWAHDPFDDGLAFYFSFNSSGHTANTLSPRTTGMAVRLVQDK